MHVAKLQCHGAVSMLTQQHADVATANHMKTLGMIHQGSEEDHW